MVLVLVLKKYGCLGLGLETQSLGLGLDKKVLFTSLPLTEAAVHCFKRTFASLHLGHLQQRVKSRWGTYWYFDITASK